MEKRTALPWHYSYRDWDDSATICNQQGQVAAIPPKLIKPQDWKDEAEFIVRACNVHDELVAIAQRFLKHCCTDCDSDLEALLKKVIAKADGSQGS